MDLATEAPTETSTTTSPLIELENVHKSFGDFKVLDGVDLKIYPKETLVIIGQSGTGKSVTLKHIVGLLAPESGRVHVFGEDLGELESRQIEKLRLRIGYLFQSGALLNWMTIADNVALPLHEHKQGMPAQKIKERVLEKLRLVNMEHAADKYPAEVSGGMKKRGGLARSIVLEPEIVLYDEPTSGLDPVIAATIDELVIRTRDTLGVTQVVVTHDMESAYRIADRIAMLYNGKIVAIGSPDEIRCHQDPLVQQFINGSSQGPITNRDQL